MGLRRRLRIERRYRSLETRRPGLGRLIREVQRQRLTYLEPEALCDLAEAAQEAESTGREGAVVEAGCGLGGSALVLALAKARNRPLLVFDLFGMIPPPTERDGDDAHRRYAEIASGRSLGIGSDRYYGYQEDLYGMVRRSFQRFHVDPGLHHVRLVKGSFQDTLYIGSPIALVHIDADWYDSVRTCLERIEPHVVPGGRMVIDDYDHWSGARKAVDEYFAGRKGFEFVRRSRLHIVKHPTGSMPDPRTPDDGA